MSWGNPTAWYLLSLTPLIIILHALRRRRRSVTVTTLFLWEDALRERRTRFSLRRLRRNAQLLLQLLVLLLLTSALAEPQWRRETRVSGDRVLVLDASASMQAVGADGSRFELARREAQRLLDELADGARMAIITAARRPVLRSFFTADRERLGKTLKALAATDEPGSLRPALLMALNLAQRGRGDEVILISDGADELPADLDPGRTRMRLVPVRGGERNVGITRFAFRQEPGGAVQLFLEVRNFGTAPAEGRVALGFDGRAATTVAFELAPGGRRTFLLPVTHTAATEAYARLEVEDDFAVDNMVYAVLGPAEDTWVLLVGEDNYFLRRALDSLPGVLMNRVSELSAQSFAAQLRGHQLIIFNRVPPPELSVGNFLLINSAPPNLPWETGEWLERPRIGGWDTDHPVLRHVNLDDLQIVRSKKLAAPAASTLVSDVEGNPLMTVHDDGSLRIVLLGFDLLESDFPLRVAFPIFISNLVRWFHPNSLRYSAKMVQAGRPAVLAVPPNVARLRVLRPDGTRQTLTVRNKLNLRYEDTSRVGMYRWQAGEHVRAFAVNLLDPRESDIRPRRHPAWSVPAATAAAGVVHATTRFYWYLPLLAGMLVLCVEWWVWCREG